MINLKTTARRIYDSIKNDPVSAIKTASVAALCCASFTYMAYMCTFNSVTVAYADGVEIGAVNADDAPAAVMQASNDASLLTYPPVKAPEITYEVRLERDSDTLSQKEIYQKVYSIVTDGYKEVYGLFIDGSFASANEDRTVLENVTKTIESEIKDKNGEDASVTSHLEIKKIYCSGEYVHSENRILSYLAGGLSYTVDLDTVTDIFTYEEDNDKSFAPNISANGGANISTSVDTLTNTKYITVNEQLPYGTVYEETDEYFEGAYIKKSDGVNGISAVTYEIRYENGKEVSRVAVSAETVMEAVDKVVYKGIKEKPKTASTGQFIWPLNDGEYIISSHYGYRDLLGETNFHAALDLAADKGVHVHAADGGEVILADLNHSRYGIHVKILHDDGTVTLYAHMSACDVQVGDRVYQGQKIGEVGSTGFSTGDHLHFEVRINNQPVDPELYLPKK